MTSTTCDIPLAVWPIEADPTLAATHARADVFRWQLAQRVVAEYTAPGDLVLGSRHDCATVLLAAANAGRRSRAVDAGGVADNTAALMVLSPQALLAAAPRPRSAVLAPKGSAELTALVTGLGVAFERLRPGGVVVTVSVGDCRRGRLVDWMPLIIETAGTEGFSYLQHVVVLRAHVRGGALEAWADGRRRPLGVRHLDLVVLHKPEVEHG